MSLFLLLKNVKNNYCKRNAFACIKISYMHKISKIFPPVKDVSPSVGGSASTLSLSHRLLLDYGIINSQGNGFNSLLPLGLRSVEKLTNIIDNEMRRNECQKLSLPLITSSSLWKKSGRFESSGSEVMKFTDRHEHEYILSPTHEESVTSLISTIQNLTDSRLPVRLYQISSRFRDEMRLKHGLLRAREFLMKDLYTFDENECEAEKTYESIMNIYANIFKTLKIPFIKAEASVGSIGGLKSHEFHVPVDIGEDSLMQCTSCKRAVNDEALSGSHTNECSYCGSPLTSFKGIEVAHTFLLGTKYSGPLSASYRDSNGNQHLLQMGCYGIGITRLLAAGIEYLSKDNNLIWPDNVAPFKVCIIPPKRGSKEASSSHWCNYLYEVVNKIEGYNNDVIIDDRTKLSIGKRLQQAQRFGYPITIVVGRRSLEAIPRFEIFNNKNKENLVISQSELLDYLRTYK